MEGDQFSFKMMTTIQPSYGLLDKNQTKILGT